jgi:5-methylcytosine-specific restriction endonuclease McrA
MLCSTSFQRGKYNKKYCSEACKEKGRRDVERARNNRRRGAVTGIPYTLRQVYDRDGGICHLCRKKVDLRLSGTDPKGPTIDHLLPISANGIDCLTNVALAHWSCNIKRGATGPAQLRLVG